MKKLLLITLAVCSLLTISAQTKQLKKLTSSDDYYKLTFTYDGQGRIVNITGSEQCVISYEGNNISIVTTTKHGDTWYTYTTTYTTTNGILASAVVDDENATFAYDANKQLVKYDNGYAPLEFTWQDGNIAETKRYRNGRTTTSTYTHNTMTAHPLVSCIWGGLDFLGWPDALVLYPYLGTLPKNLVTNCEQEGGGHSSSYEYETNSDGDVVKVTEYYDGSLDVEYTLEWETSSAGIESMGQNDDTTPASYYSVNGTKSATPRHGLNIIRMADGTVHKAIAK